MRFYNREEELALLKKQGTIGPQSVMTTLVGRRRTGKTSLLLKSAKRSLYTHR